ncbi:hypothetical protein [Bifidobacterium callitrichidarum]|uniref:hypothetical protein n=1 Tax=Bifidobacterium callitrichidarum TaxID=2052941 RepID=UPI0014728F05|nr:hypothetical protein [Bifidobacterium callitrichidarum]
MMPFAKTASAENVTPISVQTTSGNNGSQTSAAFSNFYITVGYSDGSTKIGVVRPHLTGGVDPQACVLNGTVIPDCSESYAQSELLPGVVFAWSTDPVDIRGTGWDPSTDCFGNYCVTAALKDKPTQNVTQVYSVPGTGLPDGLTSAGLTAVGIGLMAVAIIFLRKRIEM